jgi:uncharacterized lipoprotein YmbA
MSLLPAVALLLNNPRDRREDATLRKRGQRPLCRLDLTMTKANLPRCLRLAAVTAVLLLASCASSPPSSFYTLSPLAAAGGPDADIHGGSLAIGIGPVTFPQFLDRPQIVTRDSANRLALDEFHRWGGTIQDDFLRVWSENLGFLLGTSRVLAAPSEVRIPLDFRIAAEVLAFEGIPGNEAVLKVRWSVLDPYLERTLASREDVYRCPVRGAAPSPVRGAARLLGTETAGADHQAVVAALSECLGDFSRDVAEVVRALPRPAPETTPAPAVRTGSGDIPR